MEMNGSQVNETFPEHHWQSDDDPSTSDSLSLSSGETIDRPRTPPLRIHHILVLTAVAAVLMSVTHLLRQQDYLNLSQMFSSSWGAVFTISIAIDVTLVMLGFAWRRRGYSFFDMPGHWLLLTHSLSIGFFLAVAVALALRALGDNHVEMGPVGPIIVYSTIVQLASIVLNGYAAWKIADTLSWRIFFSFEAIRSVSVFAIRYFFPVSMWFVLVPLQYLPFVFLLIAAISDGIKRRPRDWPHWVGVVLPCILHISYFCRMLFS
jgi:hypothetical protein